MDARCRIQLLGGLRVQQGDRVITRFRTQQAGARSALTACRRDQTHPPELLTAPVSPDGGPKGALQPARKTSVP